MSTFMNIGILLSATDMLSPALRSAGGSLENFDGQAKETKASIAALSTASLALGETITSYLGSAFDDSQVLAAAQGELKTLEIIGEGLDAITNSATDFSNEFAGTAAPEFVQAAYDIKSGISSLSDVAVGEMTAISALTANATKSSTAEMTSLFATGFGIYRQQFEAFGASTIEGWNALSDEEKDIKFGEYFSAGIANSVQAFKTDGSNMSAALSNLGANATSAGISFAEQLSILGQLQATMSGSEAATKYRAFLDAAYGAGETLDLQFTDANNQLLSMPEILSQLKEKYGDTIDAVESAELKKAFGTGEAVSLIKQLYPETETLTSNINKMNLSLQDGTKKTREMALAANDGKAAELLDQKINNLSSTIGTALNPIMLTSMDLIGDGVVLVNDFMREHETLTTVLVSTVAVGGGLLTLLGGLGIAASATSMVLPFLSGGFGIASASMGVMATATKAVTTALLTNPIGLIATGIATAAYLIYDNWEPISSFFSDLWGGVVSLFDSGVQFIQDYLGWTPLGMLINNWTPITNFFGDILTGVENTFSSVWANIVSVSSAVANAIKMPFVAVFDWFYSKFEWIGDAVGFAADVAGDILGSIGENVSDLGSSIADGMKDASSFFVLEGGYGKEIGGQGPEASGVARLQNEVMRTGVTPANSSIYESKQQSSTKVYKSEDTIHITVQNPSSNVDVVSALEQYKRDQKNRSYEDDE